MGFCYATVIWDIQVNSGPLLGTISWLPLTCSFFSLLHNLNISRHLQTVPEWLKERLRKEDRNAVIGTAGEDGSSELCAKTLEIFAGAFGAQAGNIALNLLAAGGVYLGGGIAPKTLKTLQNGGFRDAFLDKGRLSPLLHTIPVRVILEERCALMGAAAYAEMRAAENSGRSERVASKPIG